MNHIELGRKGEEIAAFHLAREGYVIKSQNYRFGRLELDIICEKNEKLVIVEVKTRNSIAFGEPYVAVSKSKQRQIIRAANNYVIENNIEKDVQFDIISVILNDNTKKLEHIESAFYPLV